MVTTPPTQNKPVTFALRNVKAATPPPEPADAPSQAVQQPLEVVNTGVEDFDRVFSGGGEPTPTTASATTTTTAVVTTQPAPPPAVVKHGPEAAIEGDWETSDVKLPVLRVVAGSGELAQKFTVGTLLLGDDILVDAPDPRVKREVLNFIPFRLIKRFREKLSQDQIAEGVRPLTFDSLEEVMAAGGTTQYVGKTPPTFQPTAQIWMLIKRPTTEPGNAHPAFSLSLDGSDYAIAVMYLSGQGYKRMGCNIYSTIGTTLWEPEMNGNEIVRDEKGRLKRRTVLHKYHWSLEVIKIKAGEFTVPVPDVRVLPKLIAGPDVRDLVKNLLSGEVAPAVEE